MEALLNVALEYDTSLEQVRPRCQKITGFYLVKRYPLITESGLTAEDVRDLLAQAEALIDKLREAAG